jgi:hypothetical protein
MKAGGGQECEPRMSVYCVNADDYANDHGEDHTEGDMDNRARRGDTDDRNGRGSAGKGKEKPGVGVGWPFVEVCEKYTTMSAQY